MIRMIWPENVVDFNKWSKGKGKARNSAQTCQCEQAKQETEWLNQFRPLCHSNVQCIVVLFHESVQHHFVAEISLWDFQEKWIQELYRSPLSASTPRKEKTLLMFPLIPKKNPRSRRASPSRTSSNNRSSLNSPEEHALTINQLHFIQKQTFGKCIRLSTNIAVMNIN